MKTTILLFIIMIPLIGCSTNNVVLKTSYYEGANKNLVRSHTYNTKNRSVTNFENNVTTVKNIKLDSKEKDKFIKMLNTVGIKDNFCWESLKTLPDYSWKYEIILDGNKPMSECKKTPVRSEIVDTYNQIKDELKRK